MSKDGYYYRREILSQTDFVEKYDWDRNGNNINNKNTGNVGIGLSNPSYTLDISGDLHLSKGLYDSLDTTGNTGQVLMTTGSGLQWMDVSCCGTNSYWTASGADIYNNNTGNVGIGTQSPIYTLDVLGETRIQTANIRIGQLAGDINQGYSSIAIGNESGYQDQQNNSIAIGFQSGNINQGLYSIAIGLQAGLSGEGFNSVSIGNNAGSLNQGVSSIAIGSSAGYENQNSNSISIGNQAGLINQDSRSIAIGLESGFDTQGNDSVAIGYKAGKINQLSSSIAIGNQAGTNNQGVNGIAIGNMAGNTGQSTNAISIGDSCGKTNQGRYTIALGVQSGYDTQGEDGIALGRNAAFNYQGTRSIAIGYNSGMETQSSYAIAIGVDSGMNQQQQYSIAIGFRAGYNNQYQRSIILNATGTPLDNPNASGLFIAPIREQSTSKPLCYNISTKEITYSEYGNIVYSDSVYGSFTSDISQSLVGGNSTVLTYNRAEISNNCYHSGGRIYVAKNGVYKISFSIQFDQGDQNQHHPAYVFIRANGTDVPRSTSKWVLRDKDSEMVAFTEYILPLNAGQYFEIVFYSDSNAVIATAIPANAQYPFIPSIITNVYSLTTSP